MLRLTDLQASYGAAPVLQGVSLHVEKGETVALLGPNGAGKSTLLAAITGTIARRAGGIFLDGKNLVAQKTHGIVALGVALVPEGRLVFAPFTVDDNLRLGAIRLKGELGERYQFVYGLFPRLAERRRQAAGTLSGGEQQMLAIGRALMSAPRLLLLDEPSLGLSPKFVTLIFDKLGEMKRAGYTLMLVEQNAARALAIADRAYALELGRNRFEGPGTALLADPEVKRLYLGG